MLFCLTEKYKTISKMYLGYLSETSRYNKYSVFANKGWYVINNSCQKTNPPRFHIQPPKSQNEKASRIKGWCSTPPFDKSIHSLLEIRIRIRLNPLSHDVLLPVQSWDCNAGLANNQYLYRKTLASLRSSCSSDNFTALDF